MVETKNLVCGYGRRKVMEGINLKFGEGEIICLLGPNGVGKTTFFKSLLGLIKAIDGEVLINGKSLHRMKKKDVAKQIAYVPQAHNAPFDFKVLDVVLMGRSVHLGKKSTPGRQDIDKALAVLDELKIGHLKDETYTRISGGERQMVLIARALAQETKIIVLDEPTSNLDFGNQARIMEQVRKLKDRGILVVMTTHSPNQALACGSKVVVFRDGNVYAVGESEAVITDSFIQQIYGVKAKVCAVMDEKTKVCVPV